MHESCPISAAEAIVLVQGPLRRHSTGQDSSRAPDMATTLSSQALTARCVQPYSSISQHLASHNSGCPTCLSCLSELDLRPISCRQFTSRQAQSEAGSCPPFSRQQQTAQIQVHLRQ